MRSGGATFVASLALGVLLVASGLNGMGCDDDDTTTGAAGTSGGAGTAGTGGTAGTMGSAGSAATTYTLTLTGSSVEPPVITPATGGVMITLELSNSVTVTGTFAGLSSNATEAHIHAPASAGTNADMILQLTVPAATSGDVTGSAQLTPTQADYIRSGTAYVDIHSTDHPPGELRAQIQ